MPLSTYQTVNFPVHIVIPQLECVSIVCLLPIQCYQMQKGFVIFAMFPIVELVNKVILASVCSVLKGLFLI